MGDGKDSPENDFDVDTDVIDLNLLKLKEAQRALEESVKTLEDAKKKREPLSSEYKQLTKKLENIQKEMQGYKTDLAKENERISDYRNRKENVNKQLTQVPRESENRMIELKKAIREKADSAKQKYEQKQREMAALLLKEYNSNISTIKKELEQQKQEEIERAKGQMESLKKDLDNILLKETESKEKTQELEELLRSKNHEYRQVQSNNRALEEQIKAIEKEIVKISKNPDKISELTRELKGDDYSTTPNKDNYDQQLDSLASNGRKQGANDYNTNVQEKAKTDSNYNESKPAEAASEFDEKTGKIDVEYIAKSVLSEPQKEEENEIDDDPELAAFMKMIEDTKK